MQAAGGHHPEPPLLPIPGIQLLRILLCQQAEHIRRGGPLLDREADQARLLLRPDLHIGRRFHLQRQSVGAHIHLRPLDAVFPRIHTEGLVHEPFGIGPTGAVLQQVSGVPAAEGVQVIHAEARVFGAAGAGPEQPRGWAPGQGSPSRARRLRCACLRPAAASPPSRSESSPATAYGCPCHRAVPPPAPVPAAPTPSGRCRPRWRQLAR